VIANARRDDILRPSVVLGRPVFGAVLLGTGGIAFFMLLAHRTDNAATVAAVAHHRDCRFLFTATAVVAQPVTGSALAWHVGYSLWEGWIALSVLLYIVTGLFWLPVVWMQMEMRDQASAAAKAGQPLPPRYHQLFRLWFMFDSPAFGALATILWSMITRPVIEWFGTG
jgi:uncharacterized membrane protein